MFKIDWFFRFNVSDTGRLTLEELKIMMEKLGAPQTHLGLKAMIKVRINLHHYINLHVCPSLGLPSIFIINQSQEDE